MISYDELERENQTLRDQLSRLSEASLRINQNLDLDTVLQGVLDSARSLTGARYGVITLNDEGERVQDFLSSGMSAEEARRIWDTPDGMRIFQYLDNLSEPLRFPDLLGSLRSLGLPELSPPASVGETLSCLAAPVLHRGERVGNVFVADKKAGSEFSQEDEETLVRFASQAALVIANARRYNREQRARIDLETLINTSPVGVVIFDAMTCAPVSVNQEARRLVEGLRDRDQSVDLMEIITVEREDGRDVALDELSLAQVLGEAETVRAEEVVMRVPDGRSVTVLVNATPILNGDGCVESFVVTLQDMTHVEEMGRMRAEFLAMVSHELRMPLATIKGSAATVLGAPASMGWSEIVQFFKIIDQQADRVHDLIGGLLDIGRIKSGTLSVNPEPTDLALLADGAKKAFVSAGGRNSLEIELPADLPWVMADRGRIVQVMSNLLSDAARRSREDLPIRVAAVREDLFVAVSVSDGSDELPTRLVPQLFKNFPRVDDGNGEGGIGGSSLVLAICKGIVKAHGGRISVENDGPASRCTFTLPAAEVQEVGETPPSGVQLRPSSQEQVRILVVGGDPETLRFVRDTLTRAGYSLTVTGDSNEVPRLMEERKPHLVLSDMLRPGAGGIEFMDTILSTLDVPVIFLSAYGEEGLIARAFDMGAADYIDKPFSPTELLARIRVALRSQSTPTWAISPPPYSIGDLTIDYAERRVTVAGRLVQLTATEYEVLQLLSTMSGRVLTHDQLLQRVWSPDRKGEPWLVRNVVKRLRRKLGDDAGNPIYIFTEPRVGYRIGKSEESGETRP